MKQLRDAWVTVRLTDSTLLLMCRGGGPESAERAEGSCGCRCRRRPEWRGEAGASGWLMRRALCPRSPHPSVSEWVISWNRCRRRWPLRNCVLPVVYRYTGITLGSRVWQMSWKDMTEETAYSPDQRLGNVCAVKKNTILYAKGSWLCRIHLTNVLY